MHSLFRRYGKYLIALGPILLFLLVYLVVRLMFFFFTEPHTR